MVTILQCKIHTLIKYLKFLEQNHPKKVTDVHSYNCENAECMTRTFKIALHV